MDNYYRRNQILALVSRDRITTQAELRRKLAQRGIRVTQATVSRDLEKLGLAESLSAAAVFRPMLAEMEEALAAASVPTYVTLQDHFADKLVGNAKQLIEAVADPLCMIGQITDPLDDPIEEYDIHR